MLQMSVYMAEKVGFEPTEPYGSTVFKTAAFDHSATSPMRRQDTGIHPVFTSKKPHESDVFDVAL
jgi:hypothetical protein